MSDSFGSADNARTRVAAVSDVPPGTMKEVILLGRRIVIARVENSFVAFQNACLHYRVRLSEGLLEGDVVTCRWHQWKYRVTTGEVLTDESPYATLTTFPVFVEGDDVYVSHQPKTVITRRPEGWDASRTCSAAPSV